MTRVQIITNPASGKDRPFLHVINNALGRGVDWDVSITHRSGDARRHTLAALDHGVDVVAVFGGDGTVTEVAGVLAGGDVPLAILPGGTGNGVARFLGLPDELGEAAELIRDQPHLRAVDMGRINDHTFILRADIGFMAEAGAATPRVVKDRYGKWAYAFTSFKQRARLTPVPYQLTLDGEQHEVMGVLALVVNSGAVAFGNRPIAHNISLDDGLLDVLVLTRNDIIALTEVASSVVFGNRTPMLHWQVKSAQITTSQPLAMSVDGELIENTPADIDVLPGAVQVLTAAPRAPRRRLTPRQ